MIELLVVGAGLVGLRHIEAVAEVDGVRIGAIADPAPAARELAEKRGFRWVSSLQAALDGGHPDGVILATPNNMHVVDGLRAVEAGIPCLVEKPLATSAADGERLVKGAEAAKVPLLVGHHRRHNPVIETAKRTMDDGLLGQIVAVHGMFWLFKPDTYFETTWRREAGAGPVFINLIHDIDLLSWLVGDIVEVQAQTANSVRGNPVEETASILMRFANGALGTFSVSDTVAAPWSWEMTTGENPVYPQTSEACYWIGGTHGSLDLPQTRLWQHDGPRSWWEPISHAQIRTGTADPLVRQIENFKAVIEGTAEPVVPGSAGLRALSVIEAIHAASKTGSPVRLS